VVVSSSDEFSLDDDDVEKFTIDSDDDDESILFG
jgi:hypothetical protein